MRKAGGEGADGVGLRVVGVDPGASVTGWAVVEEQGSRLVHLASGLIRPKGGTLPTKLVSLFDALGCVIAKWQPSVACVEKSFVARNPQSALKLGEVRGVVALAAARSGLEVREYSPAQIKLAVTGYGRADKDQIKYAVAKLLALPRVLEEDRADALAAALCCLNRAPAEKLLGRLGPRGRGGRPRGLRAGVSQ